MRVPAALLLVISIAVIKATTTAPRDEVDDSLTTEEYAILWGLGPRKYATTASTS
ncbi:Uu.00g114140.m01.CDS01 [Anthostomella pinea]|uniref:Uu.00g114140.m01.CDS01 n=1 Tax=Anthostomella pinea TaxID=933095 RepID=A0AAI8YGI6_9PEZI|nr:Uu.00g114140.m01.CDS01 [Anthostomella pinea]